MDRLDKLSNIKKQSDSFSSYRDKEVERFELNYSGCTLIKDHYKTEDELDDDWYKYSQMPYELQLIADNESIRIFGVSCRLMYRKLKKKYRRRDIEHTELIQPVYYPKNESTGLIGINQDKYAKDVADRNDIIIIRNDYENIYDLTNDWYRFNSLDKDKRNIADTESINIYGFDNYTRYIQQYNKFIKDDIDDTDIGSHVYVSDNLVNLMDECKYETDNARKIRLIDTFAEELDNLDNKVYRDYILKRLNESIKSDITLYNSSNSVPMYIPSIDILSEDKDIVKYQINNTLRYYGFSPLEEDYYYKWKNKIRECIRENREEDVRLLGWNINIPLTRENYDLAKENMNLFIENEIGYNFVDLTKSYVYGNTRMDMNMIKENRGIFVLFFDDMNSSYVFLSTGNLDTLYTVSYTPLSVSPNKWNFMNTTYNFGTITSNMINPTVTVYYIALEKKLCDKIIKALKDITNNYTNLNVNFMQNLFYMASIQYQNQLSKKSIVFKAVNQRIICVYIFNILLQLADDKIESVDKMVILPTLKNLRDTSKKDNIYILYQGSLRLFDKNYIYALRDQYSNKYEMKSKSMKRNIKLEAYCHMIPIRESTILNPIFVDYRNRSKYLILHKNSIDIGKELEIIYKDIQDIKSIGEEKLKYYALELLFLLNINNMRRLRYKSSILDLYDKIVSYLNIDNDIMRDMYLRSDFRIYNNMNIYTNGYTIQEMSDLLNYKLK